MPHLSHDLGASVYWEVEYWQEEGGTAALRRAGGGEPPLSPTRDSTGEYASGDTAFFQGEHNEH
jgi:hypothetical protein